MAKVAGKCLVCGTTVEVAVAYSFEDAALVGALCPDCTDQEFLGDGSAILRLRSDPEGARFSLGKVTITGGAVEALAETSEHAAAFLALHVRGDWGEFGHFDEIHLTDDEYHRGCLATDNDAKINKSNVLNKRWRVMSGYTTRRGKLIWIITYIEKGNTTVLLPEEY